jgi:hypothetical protein
VERAKSRTPAESKTFPNFCLRVKSTRASPEMSKPAQMEAGNSKATMNFLRKNMDAILIG